MEKILASFYHSVAYVVRRHRYLWITRTRVAALWRQRSSTAINTVPCRILKKFSVQPVDSVLFVTYHPQGFISDYVKYYIAHFKRLGHSVVLVKIVDNLDDPLADSLMPDIDAAIVRKNAGYDFGAWAHGLQLFPEVYQGKTLWIVNDSVFGPVNEALFDGLLERIEKSDADLIGLTESHQYTDHYQSYFLVFRNLDRHAEKIRSFWNKVRNIQGKQAVIFEYELELKHYFLRLGLNCRALFHVMNISRDCNPVLYGWRQLLDAGFPFLKVSLLRPNMMNWDTGKYRESLTQLGYKCEMIDQHINAHESAIWMRLQGFIVRLGKSLSRRGP